jgi:hypothetical protein
MLKRFIRKAAAAARPVKRIGVADMSVAESAPFPVKPASIMLRNVAPGACPLAARTRAMMANATTSDPIGTASESHRG